MTKRMLIDSTHAEETRVVVLEGNRLEDFDVETSTKKQLKGNIYLAKIVRVEPSLQAAFVEFGGGRHGFLAFGEIHPDYYQIPVADRKRLLEMQEQEAREEEEAEDREAARNERGGRRGGRDARRETEASSDAAPEPTDDADTQPLEAAVEGHADEAHFAEPSAEQEPAGADALIESGYAAAADPEAAAMDAEPGDEPAVLPEAGIEAEARHDAPPAQALSVSHDIIVASDEAETLFGEADAAAEPDLLAEPMVSDAEGTVESLPAEPPPEDVGGEQEDADERPDRRTTPRFLRNYKIQEVMRRRQILLVQVVKEERGNKGAALTTYISLAGRFSVLMPNSPRGGGISRKITSGADRRRLKEITAELDLPRGMGLIVRTAGANRPKPEIIRDCEYLLNQWDQIRELTMKSMAPALIYEEASLIKRAIRDLYARDVDDILVDGEDGWRAAHDFMRMLMPTHAKKVQLWRDPQPLFAKAQVEAQLDSMLQPVVQLRSGGYLVINQTEALVAIDVNSGRSTRERGIEETALRTNLEAAEETARQLRLRDLAGLIVIDFIDMESRRNNAAVERKIKDALKNDRARIQVGSISHFGLLEMSRQRLRPSLTETSFVTCVACGGTGHTRSTESAALAVLRGIEDEGAKRRSAEITVHVAGSVAFYILNHKRVRLSEIEERFGLFVTFNADESMRAPEMRIERIRAQTTGDGPAPISQLAPPEPFEDPDEEVPVEETAAEETVQPVATAEDDAEASDEAAPQKAASGETAEDADGSRRKRRRRRRGGRREDGSEAPAGEGAGEGSGDGSEDGESDPAMAEAASSDEAGEPSETPPAEGDEEGERKRRGRRGGRRRRRVDAPEGTEETPDSDASEAPAAMPASVSVPVIAAPPPAYSGPTPANPFGGSNAFDFFDAIEMAEQERFSAPAPAPTPPPTPAPAPPAPVPVETVQHVLSPVAEAPVPHEATAIAEPAAVEPTPEPEHTPEHTPEPEAHAEAPAAAEEPRSAPAVQPTLVDAPAADKKKGWWRR